MGGLSLSWAVALTVSLRLRDGAFTDGTSRAGLT